MKKAIVLVMGFLCIFSYVEAQRINFKQLSKKEIEQSRCEFYPEAKAMILDKRGEITMEINAEGAIIYNFAEGVRIKIFDAEAASQGDIKIRFYSPKITVGNYKEKIYEVKGCTYNMEGGKIVATKLERGDIYRNRLNDYMEEISFALPAVKAGSVIEYSYLKESDYILHLPDWYFQADIPTCYNELFYQIPEYFDFQSRMMGNIQSVEREEKKTNVMLAGDSHLGKSTRLVVKNVLPVEDEPFVSNSCDLPFRMEFQLVSVKFPTQPIMQIAGNYEKFNRQLLETDHFWRSATRGNFPKELKTALEGKEAFEQACYLYDWWRNSVKWNKYHGITSDKSVSNILRERSGSVADINLNLNALFVQHGLEAWPVVLSTRGNGVVHPVYPNFQDFNYVISMVKVGDQYLFCDATSTGPIGLLPPRCLNGSGWCVNNNGGGMVPLKGSGGDKRDIASSIRLDQGKVKVDISVQKEEYAAMSTAEEYTERGEESYKEKFLSAYADWDVTSYQTTVGQSEVNHSFTLEKSYEDAEVIYLQPFLYGLPSESPFKRDTRVSVVDFPYGLFNTIKTGLVLPEGYEVEMPDVVNFSSRKRGASYMFSAFQNEDEVSFVVQVLMRQLTYVPEEYEELKFFYEKLAELSKLVVVIKKTK